jgi:choline dehydrogenase
LAEDLDVSVLVLEAGGVDEAESITDPNRWPLTLGTELDWGFTAEPNPNLNDRAIGYSMGKVLGGGSSINVSTWSRGHCADWDFYASESGDARWSYSAVLDLYRHRIEAWSGSPDPQYRGTDGIVHVQPAPEPHPFSIALLDAASTAGLPRFPSPNGRMMEEAGGCAFVDETVCNGRRRSIFRSYLYPVMDRPNITVLTDAHVTRVLFDGHRASGVAFNYGGKSLRVEVAQEVVLALGAIHTPKLLMQSGIGDEAELKWADIPVLQDLPGVGRNLHDHVAFGCVWEKTQEELPSAPRSQTACFWKTASDLDAPNFYAYAVQRPQITPENAVRFRPADAAWSLVVGMRPRSRGRIRLRGSDPADPLRIDASYLADPQDMKDLMVGLQRAREIGNSAALRRYTVREIAPGRLDENELQCFFRNGLLTFWHQCGTAKMGRDEMSVVDGKLRVHGVEALRVADASILPRVTTGNTMAPCVIIGEQAAGLLRARHGLRESAG